MNGQSARHARDKSCSNQLTLAFSAIETSRKYSGRSDSQNLRIHVGPQAADFIDDWSFSSTVENVKTGRFDQYPSYVDPNLSYVRLAV
jgi:hypothetical protein